MEEGMPTRSAQLFRSGVVVVTGGLLSILAAYGIYRLWLQRSRKDEYFENIGNSGEQSERKILVLGLDGAGKTRFSRCFCRGRRRLSTSEETTVGFYVNSVQLGKIHLNMWDVGGSKNCRAYWNKFLQDVDAVCYVVDSADPGRFQEARTELHQFLSNPDTNELLVIIIATKQDIPGAVKPNLVREAMDVEKFSHTHTFELVGVQAPDEGIRQGFVDAYNLFVSVDASDDKKNI